MRILTTGISGFIGSYLAERLLKDGHEVAGLARQTNRLAHPAFQRLLGKAQMYYGSVTDSQAVKQVMREFQPEVVCHLAAISPVAYSFDHPHEVFEVNATGTVNVAEAALREVKHLRRFIFSSSNETYGRNPKRTAFTEEDAQVPSAPYGVAKVAAEKYVQYLAMAHDFPGVCFRQTNAFGRKENSYFIVEAIVTQLLQGNVCRLGEPDPIRNFIFIEDLLDLWVKTIHAGPEVNGHVFNTGPDNGLSICELAAKISGIMGWQGEIQWHTRPVRPGEIAYLNSSSEKAKQMLGWEPKISLSEGLSRTIEIWAENLGVKSVAESFSRGELLTK